MADRGRLPGEIACGYLRIERAAAARGVRLPLPLVEDEVELAHRTRARPRGDGVAVMVNFGADLTFFAEISCDRRASGQTARW